MEHTYVRQQTILTELNWKLFYCPWLRYIQCLNTFFWLYWRNIFSCVIRSLQLRMRISTALNVRKLLCDGGLWGATLGCLCERFCSVNFSVWLISLRWWQLTVNVDVWSLLVHRNIECRSRGGNVGRWIETLTNRMEFGLRVGFTLSWMNSEHEVIHINLHLFFFCEMKLNFMLGFVIKINSKSFIRNTLQTVTLMVLNVWIKIWHLQTLWFRSEPSVLFWVNYYHYRHDGPPGRWDDLRGTSVSSN